MRLLFYLRLLFGDLDKSFSLGNVQENLTLPSESISVHEALVLAQRLLSFWKSRSTA
jgi:hypothetical protein